MCDHTKKMLINKHGLHSSKIFHYGTKAELACRNTSGNRAGGVRAGGSGGSGRSSPTNLFAGTSDFEGLVTTKPPIRLIPN